MTILRSLGVVALLGTVAAADPAEDQIKAIPGVSALGAMQFSKLGAAYEVAFQDPDLRVTGYAFKSSLDAASPWYVAFKARAGRTLQGFESLGQGFDDFIVLIAAADGTVSQSDSPRSISAALAPWFRDGKLPVKRGVNVFLATKKLDDARVGKVLRVLGIAPDAKILMNGLVGTSVLAKLAGDDVADDAPRASLTVELPAFTPPPFGNADVAALLAVRIERTTVTLAKKKKELEIAGSFDAAIGVANQSSSVSGSISVKGDEVRVTGEAKTAVKLFDRASVKLGLAADTSRNAASTLAVTAKGTAAGSQVTGALLVRSATGTAPAAMAAVLEAQNIDLSALAGGTVAFPLLDRSVLVLATAPLGSLGIAEMPDAIKPALEQLSATSIEVPRGIAFLTRLDFSKLPSSATLAKIGLSGTLLAGGSLDLDRRRVAMFASLPTFKTPAALAKAIRVSRADVKFFVDATWGDAPSAKVGVSGTLGLMLPTEVPMQATLFAEAQNTGSKFGFEGTLRSTWTSPFGLDGITVLRGAGIDLAGEITGQVRLMARGGASFDNLEYELGGGVRLNFATGVPTVTGLALLFKAKELSLLAPVKMAATTLRAVTGMVANLRTDAGKPLSANLQAKVGGLGQVDLLGAVQRLLPTSGPLATFAQFALRDVELYVATPGMDGLGFDAVGVKIAGRLTQNATVLAGVSGSVTETGMTLVGDIPRIALGPAVVTDSKLDLAADRSKLDRSHLKFAGKVAFDKVELADADVSIAATALDVRGALDLRSLGSVRFAGKITSATSFALSGSATIDPDSQDGVNLPSMSASFALGPKGGTITVGGKLGWKGTQFSVGGAFESATDWSLVGSGGAGKGGTDSLAIDVPQWLVDASKLDPKGPLPSKLTLATLSVSKGSGVSFRVGPRKASVHAKGKASVKIIDKDVVDWDFDADLDADLRVVKTLTVYNPARVSPSGCTDITCWKPGNVDIDLKVAIL